MAKKIEIPKDNNIIQIPIEEAMPDNYLPYAVEVAKDRALPDVRDGLKPVHRRILYGAYMLKAFPDKPYFKSARIVGDILGKYHPHGDTSVYDAMVILAQDFSTRKTLIDGHGNWGSQDGDSAAAMRYTEARLTNLAMEMLRDIDKDVVDMMDNYSNSELEPKVLPSRYPNLLVNGTFGIAVGLATNIPPHNLCEVIDASLAYIDDNNISTGELMKYIKGPDLPTGGVLIGKNAIKAAYESGEGRVTLRAKAHIEKLDSGKLGIVITEFPYRRSKAKLLQMISEMTDDKKHAKALEPIIDIRDESDRTGIRAVIELRKSADEEGAEKLLKYLYKKTDLQYNLPFNMVALADGKPETMGLKTILMHYINHQKDIVTRRTKKELEIALKRFHIVEGFIKAIGIMDEIIAVIRSSKSKKDAQGNLVESFGFTPVQAEAILELMLYRLTGLEIKTFEKEYKELEKDIASYRKILDSEKELLKVIRVELLEIKEKYGDERKTSIVENDEEAKIDIDELVIIEDTMITLSNEGYIKRVPLKSYNRSNTNVEDIEYREGDFNKFLIQSNTKDTILIFTSKGNLFQTKGVSIPEYKWKEKGARLDEIIKTIDLNDEKIISVFSMPNMMENKNFILITGDGTIKKTPLEKFNVSYTKVAALRLKDGDILIDVQLVEPDREEKFIKVTTEKGLEFTLEEPKLEAVDRTIMGQILFTPLPMDKIITVEYIDEYNPDTLFLGITKDGVIKKYESEKGFGKNEFKLYAASKSNILVFTDQGMVYCVKAQLFEKINENGRNILELLGSENSVILNAVALESFEMDLSIYFTTKKGLVKRSLLIEFEGSYSSTLAYKFKNENDQLIGVEIGDNNRAKDIMLITKKAMCIRFPAGSITPMGRAASGVTGISLKEDDEVIFSLLVDSLNDDSTGRINEIAVSSLEFKELTLVSAKKIKAKIEIKDVKSQNRAGRGYNLMLVVLDDYLKEIKVK